MAEPSKLSIAQLVRLTAWIRECCEKGVSEEEIVSMLLSETVRTYKIVCTDKTAGHLIEWLTRIFHSKAPETKSKPDDFGSN